MDKTTQVVDKQLAIEFIQSMRGQYIMAQALHKAIEVMKAAPERERQDSNISDMELCQKVFDFPTFVFDGESMGLRTWDNPSGICDGCENLDLGTTHNCRQKDRHWCSSDEEGADFSSCEDAVESCACLDCKEEGS